MIAVLLLLIVGAVMGISLIAGRSEIAGFTAPGSDVEAQLWASTNPSVTGPRFMEELGFYMSDDPEELGLPYYLNKTDPTLVAAQARYIELYGPHWAAVRAQRDSRLALMGATVSTGIPTLPIFVEPGFVDLTPNSVILSPMIPRRPIRTKFVDWNDTLTVGAAAFVADGSEGNFAALAEDTYGAQRLQVRVLSSRLEVTGLAQAATQGFVNLQDWRLRRRLQAVLEHQEAQVVNGLPNDANGWNGLPEMVTTNTTNLAAATITTDAIDDLFEQIHVSKGRPSFGIASHGVVNDIRKELKTDQVQNINGAPIAPVGGFTFPGGMNSVNYNGVTIMGHDLLNQGVGTKLLYLLQMDEFSFPELRPLLIEELAKVRDSRDMGLTNYLTFMDASANDPAGPPGTGIGGQHHGRIFNIA